MDYDDEGKAVSNQNKRVTSKVRFSEDFNDDSSEEKEMEYG